MWLLRIQPATNLKYVYKFLLTPKWIAVTLVTLLLLPAFNALSQWQWHRLHQRQAYNLIITKNINSAPASLRDLADVNSHVINPSNQWRLLHLTGTWDVSNQVLVRKKSFESEYGFWVVTPFKTADGAILINRGWHIAADTARESPVITNPPSGIVDVAARVRILADNPEPRPTDLPAGQVDVINPQTFTDSTIVRNAYGELVASRPDSGVDLKLIPAPTVSEGPHRSYALQWIFFAIMTVIGWIIMVRNEAQHQRTDGGTSLNTTRP